MPVRRAAKPSSDRILAAAEALFATKGYGAVSLRQLIAAAGVSTTAFYARFPSKAAVLDQLTAKLFADLQAEAATVLRSVRDLDEGILRGVDLVCDHFGPRKALVKLVIAESAALPTVLMTRQRAYAMLASFLTRYLRALDARGRIDMPMPEVIAWAIIGALEIQIARWAVWDILPGDELRSTLRQTAHAILPKEHS
jgi:AcrR family transcriptional regulator